MYNYNTNYTGFLRPGQWQNVSNGLRNHWVVSYTDTSLCVLTILGIKKYLSGVMTNASYLKCVWVLIQQMVKTDIAIKNIVPS